MTDFYSYLLEFQRDIVELLKKKTQITFIHKSLIVPVSVSVVLWD